MKELITIHCGRPRCATCDHLSQRQAIRNLYGDRYDRAWLAIATGLFVAALGLWVTM